MTEYDYVDGQSSGNDYFGKYSHCCGTDNWFVWKRRVSLANAGDSLTSSGAFGAGDILNLFNVKAGQWVRDVAIHMVTAEGATLAVTIGDGDDADGFLVAGNLNTTGWQHGSIQTTYAADYCDGTTYHSGKLYASADTIDMTLTTASADVAVFDIFVVGVDLSQGQYIL